MSKSAIIVFVKNEELGKVKTRLAKDIGNEAALLVYKKLLKRTNAITKILSVKKYLFYSNFVETEDIWNELVYHKNVQSGNNLGERITNAFEFVFAENIESCIIIGSDCFEITNQIIEDAYAKLQQNDLVIGPAEDGGYYLLGINKLHKELFLNKNWSTKTLYKETLKTAKHLKLKVAELKILNDIDTIEDLINYNENYSTE